LLFLTVLLALGVIVVFAKTFGPTRGWDPCTWGLFGLAGTLLHPLFRYARRHRTPNALELLAKDPRPPVLLLRAFRDDSRTLPGATDKGNLLTNLLTANTGSTMTFEEFLYGRLARLGPVIAVGRPGEKTPPLGAARFWVGEWQKAVDELLSEAQYVVMVMGAPAPPAMPLAPSAELHAPVGETIRSGVQPPVKEDGIVWEIKRIFSLKTPEKVVLVMPPVGEAEASVRWDWYRQFSHDRLPRFEGGEVAATFTEEGSCHVVRTQLTGWLSKSYKRYAGAYDSLLQVHVASGQPRQRLPLSETDSLRSVSPGAFIQPAKREGAKNENEPAEARLDSRITLSSPVPDVPACDHKQVLAVCVTPTGREGTNAVSDNGETAPTWITIIRMPTGDLPEWVRRSWVGLKVPVVAGQEAAGMMECRGITRGGTTFLVDGYAVRARDALPILAESSRKSIDWLVNNVSGIEAPGYTFCFPTECCERVTY
jgi:hypothetical protein